jgi:hypothetical protein
MQIVLDDEDSHASPCHDLAECGLNPRFRVASAPTAQSEDAHEMKGGYVMDVLDVIILAAMSVLAVFFASVAVLEWWEGRADQRSDAEVIQHPQRDQRASAA